MESHTTYTTTETHEAAKPAQNPATTALAIVGFITLVVLGILLAIYSARYVPEAISSAFNTLVTPDNNQPHLGVVSTTTISFSQDNTTTTTSLTPTVITTPTQTAETAPAATTKPATGTTKTTPRLYGLPNLSITVIGTGYLANGTNESFVPSAVIPAGARAAVRFSIANNGTNVSAPWTFAAVIPTHNGYVFMSPIEQPMYPGDHTVFTLGFDQADFGPGHPLTIVTDPANAVAESNEADNNATAFISVQ